MGIAPNYVKNIRLEGVSLNKNLGNIQGHNLDEDFVKKTKKAYKEITDVLQKYEIMLDWDEGQGMFFADYKQSKEIQISSSFTNHIVWK